MDFQYCSDLHLEFEDNRSWLRGNMLEPAADVLILAGDVVCFSAMERAAWFFDWVSENFKETYWIPGNHEYYRSSIECPPLHHKKIKHNVTLINNASAEIGDTFFHFSTLWTAIPQANSSRITGGMSDYHLISIDGAKLATADVNMIHLHSKRFLEESLMAHAGKKQVVITHHVPTFMNYPEEFLGSTLNPAFAVELSPIINEFQPEAWIFGHTHRNVPGFSMGKTRMRTNQLGYVGHGEHLGFAPSAILSV
ncbi:MAG: metallophosphoesterase [Flammeovirgaceae bacterium]